jgi:hypothetical protein
VFFGIRGTGDGEQGDGRGDQWQFHLEILFLSSSRPSTVAFF